MKNKKAQLIKDAIIHLILIGMIFAIFLVAIQLQASSNNVKKQVLEKQTALLIDSSIPGTTLILEKKNRNGYINDLKLEEGRVFINLEGQRYSVGYPYFTEYDIEIQELEGKFLIKIK